MSNYREIVTPEETEGYWPVFLPANNPAQGRGIRQESLIYSSHPAATRTKCLYGPSGAFGFGGCYRKRCT